MTTTEPGADERRIGAILRHFGVGYAPTSEEEEASPRDESDPQPRRRGEPQTPPIWPVGRRLRVVAAAPEDAPDSEPEETEEDDEEGEEPKPKPTGRRRPTKRRPDRRPDKSKDSGDEDGDEDDEDDEDEDAKEGGGKAQRRPRPQRRPTFAAPGIPKPRKSVLVSVRTMPSHYRWGLYNGAAIAVGFAFGLPQFFTAETAYLVATSSSWADPNCLFWYGVTAGIAWLDWRTRGWWPGLALLMRVPAASLAVGVLLYGNPA